MKLLAVGMLILISFAGQAEDEDYYINAASKFLNKHETAKSAAEWEKYWKNRLSTAAQDNGETEEDFIDRFVFDWMASKAKKMLAKEGLTIEDKLIACRIYLTYKNKKADGSARRESGPYKIPDRIVQHLTNENLDKFVKDDKLLLDDFIKKTGEK
jgi:hypothetical protein